MGMNEVQFFAAAAMAMALLRFADPASDVAARSMLAALLESPETEMMELVERAGLLQSVERAAMRHNLTVLAPPDELLELHFDAGLRDFLLRPPNLPLLQRLVLFHVIPRRITASDWTDARLRTLSGDDIHLHWRRRGKMQVPAVERSAVVDIPDLIVRQDGAVHRIRGLLVPKIVRSAYTASRIGSFKAVLGDHPALSARSLAELPWAQSLAPGSISARSLAQVPTSAQSSALGPISAQSFAEVPISARSLAEADAFDVGEMIGAMIGYGGYSEAAAMLVNLTSLAAEIGSLVGGGMRLTVLAPGDGAVDRLPPDRVRLLVRDAASVESVLRYHILAEYESEESLYGLVRGGVHGVAFRTLLGFGKDIDDQGVVEAEEVDGMVRFGRGGSAGVLVDPNIYADGRVCVQGISSVLFPPRCC